MRKRLYEFIFFKIMGWKLIGTISPEVKKCVLMVMPHTCNFDFFIGLFCRGIINLEMNFVGKKELFTFPFDYGKKEVKIGAPITTTGNYEEDMKIILAHFTGVQGRFPEKQFQV